MIRRDLPPRVPVTSLRVFEPIEAFPPPLRRSLRSLVADPSSARDAEQAERRAAWLRVLGRPDRSPGPWVRVLRVDGSVLLSPTPDEPGPAAGGPARPGGAVPPRRHLLVRSWELPVAWLAVVRPEDLTRSGGPGRYVLPMTRARARSARVLRTLRAGLGEVDVTADTEGLGRWLERFHAQSWLEVDARPVAALVDGQDGAEDIRLGLECLMDGDTAGLAAAYQRLRRRSRQLEYLSLSS